MGLRIIGAGMAGLLAAHMLRHHDPVVWEAQSALPHNHSAVLRFATSQVADVLGMEFREVNLVKAVLPWRNPVADALAYSSKCLGLYRSDRSPVLEARTSSTRRYVAPEDLVARMAKNCRIEFDSPWFPDDAGKVLSTIPMPELMHMTKYPRYDNLDFKRVSGVNLRVRIDDCDAFVSLIVPDPGEHFSRVSITGNLLIAEMPSFVLTDDLDSCSLAEEAATLLGIHPADINYNDIALTEQHYHKIAPIDEAERRNFVHWASSEKQIAWQLGRYATWRPWLQLDDLVHDIRKIDRWMRSPTSLADMEEHRIK